MYTIAGHTSFFQALREIDQEFANITKLAGCPFCGGILDVRNYLRKPRGIAELDDEFELRFSFCCRSDGCRKSVMPPSVRFLGRKVYSALIVVLFAITREWAGSEFVIGRQTGYRWRDYWQTVCERTSYFCKKTISLFPAGFEFNPDKIFSTFRTQHGGLAEAWRFTLRFFSPLSVPRAPI